jgi:hypothetical protein
MTMASAAQKLEAMRAQATGSAAVHLGLPQVRAVTRRSTPKT